MLTFIYIYIYFSIIFIFFYFLLPSLTVKYDPFEYIWYMMREKVLFIVKKMSLECICKFYLINEGSPVRIAFQQHTTPQFWVLPPYQIARQTFEEGILIADLNEKLKINFKVNNKSFLQTDCNFKRLYPIIIPYLVFHTQKKHKKPLLLHVSFSNSQPYFSY